MQNTIKGATQTAAAVAMLSVLLLSACQNDSGNTNAAEQVKIIPASRVETMSLQPTNFDDEIRLSGTIVAPDDATLSAQASGTLTSIVSLGTYVKAGAIVAQVNPRLAAASVLQAEAQVTSARSQKALATSNLKRQEGLFRDSIISALEFENIRAQVDQSEAALAQAEAVVAQAHEQLANTRVVAPFSGRVEEHLAERGEGVSPGAPIVRLVGASQVHVKAGVPERYAGDIKVGRSVLVKPVAYSMDTRRGTVTFAGVAVDPNNRTFPIEVAVDNPGGLLKPAMIAQLTISREQIADALVVPQSVVIRDENGNAVFVAEDVQGKQIARRRKVELGVASNGNVVVLEGLSAGDTVIVLGQDNLAEGDLIEVVNKATLAAVIAPGTDSK